MRFAPMAVMGLALAACGDSAENTKLKEEVSALQAKVTALERDLDEGQKLSAIFHTSMGDIGCELWPDIAPETVLNFVGLAEGTKEWTEPKSGQRTTQPLYNDTKFHRVIKGFMIQGGDPLGTGRGGPGYRFGDEVWKDVRFDKPGLLAMANAGPGTNGSQFFITSPGSMPAHLNMRHTIFGSCDLDVVAAIENVETGPGNKPVKDVVIERIEVKRGE